MTWLSNAWPSFSASSCLLGPLKPQAAAILSACFGQDGQDWVRSSVSPAALGVQVWSLMGLYHHQLIQAGGEARWSWASQPAVAVGTLGVCRAEVAACLWPPAHPLGPRLTQLPGGTWGLGPGDPRGPQGAGRAPFPTPLSARALFICIFTMVEF